MLFFFGYQCSQTRYQIHVYQTSADDYCTNDWEEEETVTAKHWTLPNKEFNGQ